MDFSKRQTNESQAGGIDSPPLKKTVTTRCSEYEHREFVLSYHKSIPPQWVDWLVEYLEESVAAGEVYSTDETIQIGWMIVKLKEDGENLSVYEPDFQTMPVEWVNSVSITLSDLFFQQYVTDSVGLEEKVDFPNMQDTGITCKRFGEDLAFNMERVQPLEDNDSGWAIVCALPDCDHEDASNLELASLYEIATRYGRIVQFLALPADCTVWETADLDDFEITHEGKKLEVKPGSFLHDQFRGATA